MTQKLLKSPSPQAAAIYRLLQNGRALSAKEIGRHLGIFPNAVYRAVKQLLALGFVRQIHRYPVKYQAAASDEALEFYLSLVRQSFQSAFGQGKHQLRTHKLLPLTFVQRRQDLLQMTAKDTYAAKSEINLIASGVEVPAETILQNQRAVERGVRVRLLVENLREISEDKLRSWKKAGVEVRRYPSIEARIFIFDHKVVYFTSYDPENIQQALGMRFDYAPYAALMDELFEQRWKLGKEISKF